MAPEVALCKLSCLSEYERIETLKSAFSQVVFSQYIINDGKFFPARSAENEVQLSLKDFCTVTTMNH